jgi:hypothetical protein
MSSPPGLITVHTKKKKQEWKLSKPSRQKLREATESWRQAERCEKISVAMKAEALALGRSVYEQEFREKWCFGWCRWVRSIGQSENYCKSLLRLYDHFAGMPQEFWDNIPMSGIAELCKIGTPPAAIKQATESALEGTRLSHKDIETLIHTHTISVQFDGPTEVARITKEDIPRNRRVLINTHCYKLNLTSTVLERETLDPRLDSAGRMTKNLIHIFQRRKNFFQVSQLLKSAIIEIEIIRSYGAGRHLSQVEVELERIRQEVLHAQPAYVTEGQDWNPASQPPADIYPEEIARPTFLSTSDRRILSEIDYFRQAQDPRSKSDWFWEDVYSGPDNAPGEEEKEVVRVSSA